MSYKNPCKDIFKNTARTKEMQEIMNDFADDLEGLWLETGNAEGFKARAKEFTNRKILEIDKVRQEVIGDIAKAKRNRKIIEDGIRERVAAGQNPTKARAEAFRAILSDTTDVTTDGKFSYDSRQQSHAAVLVNELRALDKIEGGRAFFEDAANQDLIIREAFLLGMGEKGGETGSVKALEVAKVLVNFNKRELAIKQNAGISVGERGDFVTNMRYSADLIENKFKNREDYVTYMMSHVDVKNSFVTSRDIAQSFRAMYDDILKGKDSRYQESFPDELKDSFDPRLMMSKRLSNKFNKTRKIVFKNGQAMATVMRDLVEDDLASSVMKRVSSSSRASAAIATFGTNPELAYRNLRNWLTDQDPNVEKELSGRFNRVDDMFAMVKGQRPSEGFANTVANGVTSFEVFSNMGAAVLAAGGDFPMAISFIKSRTGQSVMGSVAELVGEFKRAGLDDAATRREYGEALQILMENELGELYGRLTDAAGGDPAAMGRMANWTLTATGFHRQIFAARHATAAVLARHTAIAAREGFSNVSTTLRKHLEGYGFNDNTLKLLRVGIEKLRVPGGSRDMLTTRGLERGLKELGDLSGFREADGFKGSDAKYIQDLVDRYRSFLNDGAQIGSPSTTLRDRASMRFGMDSTHAMFQAVRVMTLFKSFGAAFPRKFAHIIKGAPGMINKPFGDAMKTKQGLSYAGSTLAGLTLMALINQEARNLAVGKVTDWDELSENPEKMAKKVGEAMVYSGVAGWAGMYMSSILDRGFKQGSGEFLLGPAFRTAADITGAMSKIGNEAFEAAVDGKSLSEASSKSFSEILMLGAKQMPNVFWGGNLLKYSTMDAIQGAFDPEGRDDRHQRDERFDEKAARRRIGE